VRTGDDLSQEDPVYVRIPLREKFWTIPKIILAVVALVLLSALVFKIYTVRKHRVEKAPQSTENVKFLAEASSLFKKGQHERARIQYLNAIQQAPNDIRGHQGLALCAMKLNRFDEARDALQRVIALSPSDISARLTLSDLFIKQGNLEIAREQAEIAVKLGPKRADAHVALGICLRLQGRLQMAQKEASSALAVAPDDVNVLSLAAAVAFDNKDFAVAKIYIDKILRLSPDTPQTQIQVAAAMRRYGRFSEANDLLAKALADDPLNITAAAEFAELDAAQGNLPGAIGRMRDLVKKRPDSEYLSSRLAAFLLASGQMDEAHAEGEALLKRYPGSSGAHFVLGNVYYQKGLLRAAEDHCRSCLAKVPDSVAGRKLLVRVLVQQGKHAAAMPLLREMAKEWPDDVETKLMQAECALMASDFSHANELLRETVKLCPANEAPHLLLARLHMAKNEYKDAAVCYRRVLEFSPDQRVALNNLAGILLRDRAGLDEALKLATRAWALYPADPQIADTLGYIHVLRGNFDPALGLLTFACSRMPREPAVRYHLAEALAGLGRVSDAELQLKEAFDISGDFDGADQARALLQRMKDGAGPRKGGG
jgi:tetratricopeptide (TPR) repeat protein